MRETKDRKNLAIELSRLAVPETRKIELEQYQSSGELASLLLWKAFLNGDISGKKVADLGCGNGILGIGALMLGASKVWFVDSDASAVEVCRRNIAGLGYDAKAVFINSDVADFDERADTVLMNPPFGVKKRGADRGFLEKAFATANRIYSLHKIESERFIAGISAENGFSVAEIMPIDIKVFKGYWFHKKKSVDVKIGLWVMKKIKS